MVLYVLVSLTVLKVFVPCPCGAVPFELILASAQFPCSPCSCVLMFLCSPCSCVLPVLQFSLFICSSCSFVLVFSLFLCSPYSYVLSVFLLSLFFCSLCSLSVSLFFLTFYILCSSVVFSHCSIVLFLDLFLAADCLYLHCSLPPPLPPPMILPFNVCRIHINNKTRGDTI